jgi:hypothetical protein
MMRARNYAKLHRRDGGVACSACNQFRPGRQALSASNYRELMRRRFAQWNDIVKTSTL